MWIVGFIFTSILKPKFHFLLHIYEKYFEYPSTKENCLSRQDVYFHTCITLICFLLMFTFHIICSLYAYLDFRKSNTINLLSLAFHGWSLLSKLSLQRCAVSNVQNYLFWQILQLPSSPPTAYPIQGFQNCPTTTHSPWRWQMPCLPKQWIILSI
jgi:hypothetical protein